MKYITIIIVIVCYFFLLGFGLNFLLQDEFITSVGAEGNSSFSIPDTSDINMTTDDIPDEVTLKTFPSTLKIMFGFRTPIPRGIPSPLAVIISFINWFLIILLGVSVYRVINPFA